MTPTKLMDVNLGPYSPHNKIIAFANIKLRDSSERSWRERVLMDQVRKII